MRAPTIRLVLGLVALASSAAGCGDEAPPPAPGGNKTPAPKTVRPGSTIAVAPVVTYRRAEDRVTSDAEKKAIRHKFSERDFAPDLSGTDNRDPFRSFVVSQPGIGAAGGTPIEATEQCPKKRQWARGFSARELKLVGIVARGTVRYALFSDPSQYGYVIHPGDCIGKEKARVKEIGASFVTLEISSEVAPNQPPRPAEQRSIQLHPKDLPIGETETELTDGPADANDDSPRGGRPAPSPTGPATGGAPDSVTPPVRPSPPTQQ